MKVKSPEAQMIANGYEHGPMMFRVYFTHKELDKVQECLNVVGQYNAFRAKSAFDALQKLEDAGLLFSIEFGREYSPVIYLSTQGGTFLNDNWLEYTGEKHAENVKAVRKAFSRTHFDEFQVTYNEKGVPQIRIWWD